MSKIDRKIVEAKFDNRQFNAGIKDTISKLGELKNSLKLTGAVDGLSNVKGAADKVNFDNATFSVSKFQVAALAAFAAIAYQATKVGHLVTDSLGIGNAVEGFAEYELKLGSIQTIMAGTGESLEVVNGYLDELNGYADRTIYSFADMTTNIGKFTNAGVALPDAVASIQGISNVAALAGSNAQQASNAMYNFAQAIATGSVKLIDWKSIEIAGLATVGFKETLLESAVAAGTLKRAGDGMYKTLKGTPVEAMTGFNQSLQEAWLDTDTLNGALAVYSDETTEIGRAAFAAAQDVKTFSQLIDTVKEGVGSGWAASFEILIGNFDEAKELWTGVNDAIGTFTNNSAMARNKVLSDWKALGGRTQLIDTIGQAFKNVIAIIKPVSNAFRTVFPKRTGEDLYKFTTLLQKLVNSFKIGVETSGNIKRSFVGLFSILKFGLEILKGVGKIISGVFSLFPSGSANISGLTATVGDFFTTMLEKVEASDAIAKIVNRINLAIAAFVAYLKLAFADVSVFATKAKAEFEVFLDDSEVFIDRVKVKFGELKVIFLEVKAAIGDFLQGVGGQLPKFNSVTDATDDATEATGKLQAAWEVLVSIFGEIKNLFGPIFAEIFGFFDGIKQRFVDFFDSLNISGEGVFKGISLAGLLAFVVSFKKIVDGLGFGARADMFEGIVDGLDALTGVMRSMQNTLRAATLILIAVAIGVLVASLKVLSGIDQAGLTRGSVAIGVLFAQLIAATKGFKTVGGAKGMATTAATLVIFGVALRVLASSVAKLGAMSTEDLLKGVGGLGLITAMLVAAASQLGGEKDNMFAAGAGFALMADGVRKVGNAVAKLGQLSWEEIGKGLVGMVGIIAALTAFNRYSTGTKGGFSQGAGLLLTSLAIKVLADSIQDIGAMSYETIAKGLVTIGLILAAFAALGNTLEKDTGLAKSGAAILLVAGAMVILGVAMSQFGNLSWEEIAKGITIMATSLTIIGLALALAHDNSIGAATSIAIVAFALLLIGKVMQKLGGLTFEEITNGVIAIAAVMLILVVALNAMEGTLAGAAALVVASAALVVLAHVMEQLGKLSWDQILKGLTVIVITLLAIGVAGSVLAPIAPALLLIAGAMALVGAAVLLAGVGAYYFAKALVKTTNIIENSEGAVKSFLTMLIKLLPMLGEYMGKALAAFGEAVVKAAPSLIRGFTAVLSGFIDAAITLLPKIFDLLEGLILEVLDFLEGIIPELVILGFKIINGLLEGFAELIPEAVDLLMKMATDILNNLAGRIPEFAQAARDYIVAFLTAIEKHLPDIIDAATELITTFMTEMGESAAVVAETAGDVIATFLEALAVSIDNDIDRIVAAGKDIAASILSGLTGGLTDSINLGKVGDAVSKVFNGVISSANNILDAHSPSRVFVEIGKSITDGLIIGLVGGSNSVNQTLGKLFTELSTGVAETKDDIASYRNELDRLTDANKAGTKEFKETTAALEAAEAELIKLESALTYLTDTSSAHKAKLRALGVEYDQVTKKIEETSDQLAEARKLRDDFNESTVAQYNKTPNIDEETGLASYLKNLRTSIRELRAFETALKGLRDIGLSDSAYKDLVEQGPSALKFAEELLAAGSDGVDRVNRLQTQLGDSATRLGEVASRELYQAGVDSAYGLLQGLIDNRDEIQAVMTGIAKAMTDAIKAELGIQSPSKVMSGLGKEVSKGLALGIDSGIGDVSKTTKSLGASAVDAMRKSISDMNDILNIDGDMTPVIRPIIDLSEIRKGASEISNAFGDKALAVSGAYSRATQTSVGYESNRVRATTNGGQANVSGVGVTYIQNNNSPKTLSSAEIYRQTRNQLSTTKEALNAT